jgi:hypothetical protein
VKRIVVEPVISEQCLSQSNTVTLSLSNIVDKTINALEVDFSLHSVDLISPRTVKLSCEAY